MKRPLVRRLPAAQTLRWLLPALCCAMGWDGSGSNAFAQRDLIPTQAYSTIFNEYYDGRYGDALKDWTREGRGGIKSISGSWIDSICYHTMVAECHYQLGQYPEALERYTAALTLFSKYNDWLIRVQPVAIKAASSGQIRPCPWGRSSRNAPPGHVPDQMMMSQGNFNANEVIRQGGVIQQPVIFPIQASEIARCTALALRRRRELLGPAGAHDSLNADLVAQLMRRPVAPNDWKEAWIDVQLGLAYAAVGNDGQAKGLLQRGLIAAGQFDHPLTATALFELGRIALAQGDIAAAARSFEEASYSAFHYGDAGLIEEALRYGNTTHLLGNPQQPYPPLEAAANWARVKGITILRASATLSAAEGLATRGRTAEATEMLALAKTIMGSRDMARAKAGARLNYLTALCLYQQGKTTAGDEALAPVLAFQRGGGSLWLYHISLADALSTSGKVSDRVAMNLYENVLRDPQRADWLTDPLESLSVLVTPHPLPIEHWFEVALQRKEFERALEISDMARRHRFLSTMPMGGRLLGLEWMMEGPDDLLDQDAKLQRQDLLNRHPKYSELARMVRQLRTELRQMPLAPDDPAIARSQAEKLAQLADASQAQEVLLREVAVRREPATLIFPPLKPIKEIQQALPEKTALLVFFATSQRLYGCLMSRDSYPVWEIGSVPTLRKQIESMLRALGNYEGNQTVLVADLKNEDWKKSAKAVVDLLLKGSKARLPGDFDEIVIVPDSLLWYLPFEALQGGEARQTDSLITRVRIRYAPTIGLALPDGRPRRASGNTAVVVGRMFPGASDSAAQAAFEHLSQSVKGCVPLRGPMPASSSIYSTLFDRLVVFDDLTAAESGPYAWSPVPIDRGTPGSPLEAWIPLPWGGPEQVVLPGFHTPAENSLKKLSLSSAGSDVFLSVCGLMASGSRTVLLSRWRTGGQTSFDVSREFVQELPHLAASRAWQRSVFLTMDTPLSVEAEPRVKTTAGSDSTTAQHPFFWSGYLLVDSGAEPLTDDEPAAVIEPKPE